MSIVLPETMHYYAAKKTIIQDRTFSFEADFGASIPYNRICPSLFFIYTYVPGLIYGHFYEYNFALLQTCPLSAQWEIYRLYEPCHT